MIPSHCARWAGWAAWVFASGCGYTVGSGLDANGVRTVAVEVVGNQTWRQGLEEPLTEEILRQLVRTDLLPAPAATADAILEVEITDARGQALVSGGVLDPVREGALELAVFAHLRDRRSGRTLSARHLIDRAEYRTTIGQGLDSTATPELVSDLARKIILALEAPF